jgi:hypothetical protein
MLLDICSIWQIQARLSPHLTSLELQCIVQETLLPADITDALQSGLRCSSEVRAALLSGRPVSRGDLLGSRRSLEGLVRLSRGCGSALFELELGC